MPFNIDKKEVFAALVASLQAELERTIGASKDAAQYATDEESRAESQWDTQGLEASYLAAGQASKARQLGEAIDLLRGSREMLLAPKTEVTLGALTACEIGGVTESFFLAPAAGGQVLVVDGTEVTVITPQSPVGARILGKRAGDGFTLASGAAGAVTDVG